MEIMNSPPDHINILWYDLVLHFWRERWPAADKLFPRPRQISRPRRPWLKGIKYHWTV